MGTNVPIPTLGPTGFEAPAESVVRAGVFADYDSAFGGNLNPASSTPQGQLTDAEAALLGALNDLYLYYVSQVDPATAAGRMQDAIGRIYYQTRIAAQPTVVIVTLTGSPGTIIPPGALAQASDGTVFQALGSVTIPAGGTVDTEFAAIDVGPIACLAHALTTVYQAIPGWDTIDNATDGTPGRYVETRNDFEIRRGLSVSANANGILSALRGAVLNVSGVLDAYVTENSSGDDLPVGGVTLPPNSLYVAAVGGTDVDVARAIWSKKPPGCDYYTGNTTITVQDTVGYSTPYPSYDVTFERPAALRIYIDVELGSNTSVPSDVIAQVRAVVLAAFNGQDDQPRARIGATIFASRFYAGIASLGSWVQIRNVKVGTTGPGASDTVTVDIDQEPTLDGADVSVNLT